MNFCSSFFLQIPTGRTLKLHFPEQGTPHLEIPSSSRRRKRATSALIKLCAVSSKGAVSNRYPTRCTLPILRGRSGSHCFANHGVQGLVDPHRSFPPPK